VYWRYKKRISRKNLLGIEVPTPPIVEQKKIITELTERFNTTDELIGVLTNKISTVNLLKKSYLQDAFTGKL
jgi:restriction endonuclease S subunit